MKNDDFISVTDIVSACYCEQKTVFDIRYGKRKTIEIQQLANEGTRQHKQFENQARQIAASDSRCFVASAIYGIDAPQTNFLRIWRDRVLMPHLAGRLLVSIYYRLSPVMIAVGRGIPGTFWLARKILDVCVRRMGWKP